MVVVIKEGIQTTPEEGHGVPPPPSKELIARIDAVKTIYPVNSVLTNVSLLNILTSLGKLGELSS